MVTCKKCSHICVCPFADGAEYSDMDCIRADCEHFAPTADVIPRAEHDAKISEIFEDLEKNLLCGNPVYYVGEAQKIVAELKKKYLPKGE